MAISDKLTKLSTDITNAYNSVQEKGGTIPTNKNTENLSSSISSIKSYEDEYTKLISRRANFKSLNLPPNITAISVYAFRSCTSLTQIDLPSGVTEIGAFAFEDCRALTQISLPSGLTSIGSYAFGGCSELTQINLPSGLTRIGSYAFQDCPKLTIVKVAALTPPKLSYRAFLNDDNLIRIEVPSSSLEAYKSAQEWSNYADIIVGV